MIVRKNAKFFQPNEKTAFTNAVVALKQRPSQFHPDDASYSRYDDYVEVHLNAMNAMMTAHMQNWGHLSSAFGPWHRVYLYHFESELRAIDPSVTLPYWDWTDAASTAAVFAPDLLGSDGRPEDGRVMDGPFAGDAGKWQIVVKDAASVPDYLVRRFGKDPSATALPTAPSQAEVMARKIYDVAPWYDRMRTPAQRADVDKLFRFGLEVNLHNLVHRYIGGHMVLAASPNDPVFFLHHCNLDRLWSAWEQDVGKQDPYEPQHNGPPGQSGDSSLIYHFPSSPAPWLGDSKPQDVYDSRAQLSVGYDTDTATPDHLELTAMRMPPAMQMIMPPSMMYPLPEEYQGTPQSPRELFVLRSEFQ